MRSGRGGGALSWEALIRTWGSLAQDHAHRVEQVHRNCKPVAGRAGRDLAAEHATDLEGDQRERHEFPRVIGTLDPKADRMGQRRDAVAVEEPKVLRRRHQAPLRAGRPRRQGTEVSGRQHDDSIRPEMVREQREGLLRVRQMLDDVEEDDDIQGAKRVESRFAQQAADDVQAEIASIGSSRLRRLDAAHLKSGAAGFIEKEAVGATDLKQVALWLAPLDEFDRAAELAPQHGFRAAIIGVAVGLTAGKVAIVIIGEGIEARCLGASQSAVTTLKDVATVLDVKKPMRRRPTARGTFKRKRSLVVSHQHIRPPNGVSSVQKNVSDAELFRLANG